MLEVRNLWAGYEGTAVVREVDLEVPGREATAVLGPNGAGKSTLFRAIAGLIRPQRGVVIFDGSPIHGLPPHEISRRGLVYVPAERELFPQLTVLENLELGAYSSPEGLRSRLRLVFDLFPRLAERRGQRAGTLSGGEQQMLAIARALMSQPKLILLDEPSTGLAPRLVAELYRQLEVLQREGVTILLAEQQVRAALGLCRRVYVLRDGRVVFRGAASDLWGKSELRQAYLGEPRGMESVGGVAGG
ncbi:MAG: ABC transporter ATP-binding protein [Armatimonadota bacterium]|nr:ABC transporter ATP-binding protein [Armatimonadota bacterium]MDR7439506.1 ABC transporter ATP-binding protein [Armatimonadota bacterium]MDR7563117.1 ABC transporter ATP-binding protein [Armatimonadota bacterium]MDR7568418.1 ABC transporter ATP-binding protein [Armatimonadota bacterium]MDR7600966.1 ABC transporter ATP-binding protein [Armatimonadota bacterium]